MHLDLPRELCQCDRALGVPAVWLQSVLDQRLHLLWGVRRWHLVQSCHVQVRVQAGLCQCCALCRLKSFGGPGCSKAPEICITTTTIILTIIIIDDCDGGSFRTITLVLPRAGVRGVVRSGSVGHALSGPSAYPRYKCVSPLGHLHDLGFAYNLQAYNLQAGVADLNSMSYYGALHRNRQDRGGRVLPDAI
jgi:hypothetical protein